MSNKHKKKPAQELKYTINEHSNDTPIIYLNYPKPYHRVSRIKKISKIFLGLVLFPFYWGMAYLVHTPGLAIRGLCAFKGICLLLIGKDIKHIYNLIMFPLDSFRYFEFDFMWHTIRALEMQTYLDVSSPRLLPIMIIDRYKRLIADLINPDINDLSMTITLAKSFGISNRCRFHHTLIKDTHLKPNSFDVITSMSVIEHIPDDKDAIRIMWDLLKPGGVLLISVPCAAKASEEYTNLNDYGLIETDENGFVFWQRYYDEYLIIDRIYSITGHPRRFQIYGEKKAGSYHQNVTQKRSDSFYPYWREPFIMGLEYEFKSKLADLPGIGVIAMEFVKPN